MEKALNLIYSCLLVYPEEFYQDTIQESRNRIEKRDQGDISPLALTLKLKIPIWTNDLDFQIPEVKESVHVYTTEDLIKILKTYPDHG